MSIQTGPAPEVTINASGDLHVAGWDTPAVQVTTDDPGDNLRTRQDGEHIWIDLRDDATLRVPAGARLHITRVSGDLHLQEVTGAVKIDAIDGDADVRQGGALEISRVSGDCTVKTLDGALQIGSVDGDFVLREGTALHIGRVNGDASIRGLDGSLEIGSVNGDATVRDVAAAVHMGRVGGDASLVDLDGPAQIDQVQGDLTLEAISGPAHFGQVNGDMSAVELEGPLQAGRVNGDVDLRMNFGAEAPVAVTAGGDIACLVDARSSASFSLHAASVRCQIPGVTPQQSSNRDMAFTVGAGGAPVALRADGKIVVRAAAGDWPHGKEGAYEFGLEEGMESFGEDLARRIENEVEQKLRLLDERLSALNVHLSERDEGSLKRARERVRQQGERARQRAERAAQRAKRHAAGRGSFGVSSPGVSARAPRQPAAPAPPVPPSEPVRDEERLAILRMVAEKKISPADAEKLLAALEP